MSESETFDEWAIVELFGHRKIAGRVVEQQVGGASFVRVDVPGPDGSDAGATSSLYNPQAIYAMHPCSEEVARMAAQGQRHEPVSRWDLPEDVQNAIASAASRDGDGRHF